MNHFNFLYGDRYASKEELQFKYFNLSVFGFASHRRIYWPPSWNETSLVIQKFLKIAKEGPSLLNGFRSVENVRLKHFM